MAAWSVQAAYPKPACLCWDETPRVPLLGPLPLRAGSLLALMNPRADSSELLLLSKRVLQPALGKTPIFPSPLH